MTTNRQQKAGDKEGNNETSLSHKSHQVTRKTFYCMTHFYDNNDDIINLSNKLKSICVHYYYGKEVCPTTGKLHLQGFFKLKTPMRITELNHLNCHLTASLGSADQNEAYCGKDGDVTKWGYPKPIKIFETLLDWQQAIHDLVINTEPDGRSIHWYWDDVGNKGKSQFCKYMYVKYGIVTIQGGKCPDIMNILFNLDCSALKAIIIDLPRSSGNKISEKAVECILNGMITNTKFETGVKVFNPPHVVVFSNAEPFIETMSLDRWKIHKIV